MLAASVNAVLVLMIVGNENANCQVEEDVTV